MKDLVVYTAIFGNYDAVHVPKEKEYLKDRADFVLFTDNENIKSDFYQVKIVKMPHKDPVRANRYFKMLTHKVLPDYKYSLYIDGSILLKSCDYQRLVSEYLSNSDIAAFKHPNRTCLYDESEWVKSQHIDPVKVIQRQMKRYIGEGFPKDFGLTAGTFLLRRHTSAIVTFNELWWGEYLKGSRRDQLCLDYVRWKSGIAFSYMIGNWDNNLIGKRMSHKSKMYGANKKNGMKRLIPLKLKKAIKYKLNKEYRSEIDRGKEFQRVQSLEPAKPFSTDFMGHELKAMDRNSFMYMYREIFGDKIYEFIPTSETPYIIDGGANVGLASIFFAQRYPKAEIVAFEADPAIAETCQQNLTSFQCKNVRLISKALWSEKTTLSFHSEGTDAGRLSENDENNTIVETDVLSEYLYKKVDFLKLDIEGAEVAVIEEIKDKLHLVNNLFVEYHSFVEKEQKLEKILQIIKDNGFRYILNTPSIKNKTPLKTKLDFLGMDFYINIFATRN
jgi:FkbM family methyltransferase